MPYLLPLEFELVRTIVVPCSIKFIQINREFLNFMFGSANRRQSQKLKIDREDQSLLASRLPSYYNMCFPGVKVSNFIKKLDVTDV